MTDASWPKALARRVQSYFAARELLGALLILVLALAVFFSPALLGNGYFAPADIIRGFASFSNGFEAHNTLLSDPLVQFLPWFKLSRELIHSGHLPLWNIYSGGGLPLMANMQSQVLWPLSVFIYLFSFKVGLILYSAGKLLAVGFFTYLYLRKIQVMSSVALIGAIGFMFAGFNVVWLMWPHTNAVFLLPLGLYLTEHYFQTGEIKALFWFSLAFAVGLFGGHPETLFHIMFAVSLYILFKLILHYPNLRTLVKHGLRWVWAGILGIGLSAVLLLPFVEYLQLSQVWADRTAQANGHFLPKLTFLLNVIPDFLGNPAIRDKYYGYGANTNYNESTMGYVGIVLLFLALHAFLWHWRDKLVGFFIFLGAFCVAVAYKFPIIFDFVTSLPGFQPTANQRLMLVFAFSMTVLGSLALQKIAESANSRKKMLITSLVFTAAVTVLFFYTRDSLALLLGNSRWDLARITTWQLIFVGVFLINFAALLTVLFFVPLRYRLAVLGLIVMVETGLHGAIYNTVSSQENFYPQDPAVRYLAEEFPRGYYKTYVSEGILLPPNLGSWYGFNHTTDNDALGLNSYVQLKRRIGVLRSGWETYGDPVDLNVLAFLGTKYLVFPLVAGQKMLDEHPVKLKLGFQEGQTMILTQSALPRAYFIPSSPATISEKVRNLLDHPNESDVQPVSSYKLALNGSEEIESSVAGDGYLILNENYYPGWEAVVNRSSVAIENVMGLRAIPLRAGENSIQTFYHPKSFRVGLLISILSIIVWLGCLFWRNSQKK